MCLYCLKFVFVSGLRFVPCSEVRGLGGLINLFLIYPTFDVDFVFDQ